jgi:hypothetical protein
MDQIVSAGLKEVYDQRDYRIFNDIIEPARYSFWDKKMEYNQDKVHRNSCFIHWFVWALTDLTWYVFAVDEIKKLVDEAWTTDWADESWGWYFQQAGKFVVKKFNEKWIKNISYYRVSYWEYKKLLELGYSIVVWFNVSREIMRDKEDDGILNHSWWAYWTTTNWHCVRISMNSWKVYVIDNYVWKNNYKNIYEIKDIEAECKQWNFFTCWYIFVIKEKWVRDWYEGLTTDMKVVKLRARKN